MRLLCLKSSKKLYALQDFPERDWKLFRDLRVDALDRFCERVLADIEKLIDDKDQSAHQKYFATWRLLKDRDKDIEVAFNEARRSIAMQQLVMIWRLRLLTEEEFGRFSQETRDTIMRWLRE